MKLNIMDEVNRDSILTQGLTTGFLSQYLYQTYVAVLPWLLPCFPLIILVCKFGRANARIKGEEVTWGKTIKMAINKIFNYICWIMIACTLSMAFQISAITFIIMAVVYGLEVLKLILRYVQSQGYQVDEKQAIVIFFRLIISKYIGVDITQKDFKEDESE